MDADVENRRGAHFVVGVGELIWDMLPGGRQLGGAPSNFAHHARLLGAASAVASRVGDDEPGREARARLRFSGVAADHVQTDRTHPTGTVGVELDARGEARFKMNPDSAWDYLELTPDWEQMASSADAVCFGTLGQRHPQGREAILGFLRLTRPDALRLFDVNLRHSFFTPEMLAESLTLANVVKLNSDELMTAAAMLGLSASGETELCGRLIDAFALKLVALTRGAAGSLLVGENRAVEHPGEEVSVVDTIGCGDAFAAALAVCRLRGLPLETTGAAANRLGAWVATRSGATPAADAATLARVFEGLHEFVS